MVITKKPTPQTIQNNGVDVDALINKGGSVALSTSIQQVEAPSSEDEKKAQRVNLRLPSDWLKQIDDLLEARPVKISRHTWLLEAVIEKLNEDKKANQGTL